MVQTITPAWLARVRVPYDEDATLHDRLVEGWNCLFPDERAEAITQCRREGHAPRLDLGYTRVCTCCLHYADG